MKFRDSEVRKSKMLISTNRNTDGTYPVQSFTNPLVIASVLKPEGTPVTTGAAYSITAKPAGLTNQITVNPATGEVTFGAEALTKVNTDGPQTVTVQAAHQGKTASYTFTLTDHFSGRMDHSSVVLRVGEDEDIYVIGGTTQIDPTVSTDNEVWRSSDGGLTWDQAAGSIRFNPVRSAHNSIVLGNDIYVIAGQNFPSVTRYHNDVWKSTDRGLSWVQTADSDPNKRFNTRSFASAQVLKGAIYFMGGLSTAAVHNDVYKSTDGGRTWPLLPQPSNPEHRFDRRNGHSSVVLGVGDTAELYVIGGKSSGTTRFDDVWKSADGQTWSRVSGTMPGGTEIGTPFNPARSLHTLASVKDGSHAGLYLIAGETAASKLGDVWKSTDQGETWTEVTTPSTPAPFGIRAGHTSVVRGTTMYLIGGSDDDGTTMYNDVWKSDDGGVTWVNVHKNP